MWTSPPSTARSTASRASAVSTATPTSRATRTGRTPRNWPTSTAPAATAASAACTPRACTDRWWPRASPWPRAAGPATAPTRSGRRPTPSRRSTASTSPSCAVAATRRAVRSRDFSEIAQDSILTHYQESIHGEGLYKRGLTNSAVCSDCHTAHDVRDSHDPASSISRERVAQTCQQCHGRIEDVHQKVIEGAAVGGRAPQGARLHRVPPAPRDRAASSTTRA